MYPYQLSSVSPSSEQNILPFCCSDQELMLNTVSHSPWRLEHPYQLSIEKSRCLTHVQTRSGLHVNGTLDEENKTHISWFSPPSRTFFEATLATSIAVLVVPWLSSWDDPTGK